MLDFALLLKETNTIPEITQQIIPFLRSQHTKDLGFVTGILTSDGLDKLPHHKDQLLRFTQKIRQEVEYPVFSFPEIFAEQRREQIGYYTANADEIKLFCRALITKSGVTKVFFTPGWERSSGCQDEYRIAFESGIQCIMLAHY